MTQTKLVTDLDRLKDYVIEMNKANSKINNCLKDKKDLEKSFEKLEQELMNLRDDHRNSKERLRNAEVLLNEKAEKIDL